jgi:asparagine synthetase B (glutamine-hydrolysing)
MQESDSHHVRNSRHFDTHGNRDIDREVLRRMNESQHHRGPDEGELYLEKGSAWATAACR